MAIAPLSPSLAAFLSPVLLFPPSKNNNASCPPISPSISLRVVIAPIDRVSTLPVVLPESSVFLLCRRRCSSSTGTTRMPFPRDEAQQVPAANASLSFIYISTHLLHIYTIYTYGLVHLVCLACHSELVLGPKHLSLSRVWAPMVFRIFFCFFLAIG